jgi:hypothetical protein
MARSPKKQVNKRIYPKDDSPVIFNLIDDNQINFIGRYIEEEEMFMLSLNDNESDFVPRTHVEKWCYVLDHPTIQSECLPKKRSSRKKKNDETTDDSNPKNSNQTFSIPIQSELPPFIQDIVNNIQQELGGVFHSVNVKVVGEDDLHTLPTNLLEQIRDNAVKEENWDLATKVRDIINKRNNE